MAPVAYISRRVVTPAGIVPACLMVEHGRIQSVLLPENIAGASEVHDFGDLCILPGLVDSHVHINEPGRTGWEGFATATRAAAAGGYTTLIDMPLNCLPETTTVAALEEKRAAATGQCWVDWRPWGGVVNGNQRHIGPLAAAGVPGFKCFLIYPGCDGFTQVDEDELRQALPHVARTGLPLLVHAELAGPIDTANALLAHVAEADWRRYSTYLASRPDAAEIAAITLMIALCREYGARVHIVHLSTAEALPMLAAARAEGLPITVETCPHYLHFAAEDIRDGATLLKCAPPIRSRDNRERLWQGLREGIIDLVATDHSPCPPQMKRLDEGSFKTAWGGIASLSVGLPVMWTEMRARGFTLHDLARWMSAAPAKLAGVCATKGQLVNGSDADFVVFDPEQSFTLTENRLHYRHPVSPYLGEHLIGEVRSTYVRGQKVFDRGSFAAGPIGREVRP